MAPQGEICNVGAAVTFTINGKQQVLGSNIPPTMTLVDYIRDEAKLTGTKVLCREAGCGLCTVVASVLDPVTNNPHTFSVRTCQTLVYSCSGWAIETIESLGDRYKGYDQLEKALHGFYGTQCGYCSPGMIMTMYGEMKSKGRLMKDEIEKCLDGNICRCTGYRPIIDAFKSLALDAPQELKDKLEDIEDVYKETCPKSGEPCKGKCDEKVEPCPTKSTPLPPPSDELKITFGKTTWYRPITLKGLSNIIRLSKPDDNVRLVVGNTGAGVFKHDGPHRLYVNTSAIQEFYQVSRASTLVLGANVSLARAIEAFGMAAKSHVDFKHLENLVKHWEVVANVGVRNIGSWAGNLMMKHAHPEFPSDIFLTLLAVDGTLKIVNALDNSMEDVPLDNFLSYDMTKKIIHSISIPKQPENTIIRTFKITPRAVNAHAYVNAAFKFRVDKSDNFKLLEKPTILFGGINKDFVHAKNTETYLASVKLYNRGVMLKAVTTLAEELNPADNFYDASPEYRISLAQTLFYKTIVGILGKKVSPEFVSGGNILKRGPSSSSQAYDKNDDTWPVGQPIPKLESRVQISGEGVYVDDIDTLHNELHGAFVQTTVANATISSVDPAAALELEGVVSYIDQNDIIGKNSFIATAAPFPDPVFAAGKSLYAGQSVGLIVAKTRAKAKEAAKLVKITYADEKKPILTIKERLNTLKADTSKTEVFGEDLEACMKNAPNTIVGELNQGTQFHLPMEALCSRVVPIEDGYDVHTTTQWPNEAQAAMANVLDIPNNEINITVRRIGGAYGGKITRGHIVLCAAAVAARKLKQPVRITLDLNSHMTLVGWRNPYYSKYRVGFDNDGKLAAVEVDFVADAGHVSNESAATQAFLMIMNCYQSKSWKLSPRVVNTDTAANTYCRTPGHVDALATIENIIEHVAVHLNKDPMEIRKINLLSDGETRKNAPKGPNLVKDKLLPLLQTSASIDERKTEISKFNSANRWIKRGLSVIPLFYDFNYPSVFRYTAQVAIYGSDGSVAICHGGIEMGQGINVKAAQVAAQILGIEVSRIKIKPTNTFAGANSIVTGGSFGSDLVCHAVKVCCEKLKGRIDEVAKKLKNRPEWPALIKMCDGANVDLAERYFCNEHPNGYDIWAVICTEVELDVLTGQYIITRSDIIEDCGRSLNPYVDIGQIEGSVIMGYGLYTSELVKYNTDTGERLSNGTWEYKPPTASDIPVDFRVTLLPKGDNPNAGVARSKASGEPALCLSYSVVTALRQAITSARRDGGFTGWFEIDTPLTVEKAQLLCKNSPSQYVLRKPSKDEVDLTEYEILDDSKVDLHDSKTCSVH